MLKTKANYMFIKYFVLGHYSVARSVQFTTVNPEVMCLSPRRVTHCSNILHSSVV